MARLHKYRYPWRWRDKLEQSLEDAKHGRHRSQDEWLQDINEQQAELDRLMDKSASLPPGEVVGAVLSWPVGDGAAWYIVIKEKPLTLQWIPFIDAYQANPLIIRGLRKADVLQELEFQRNDKRKRLKPIKFKSEHHPRA